MLFCAPKIISMSFNFYFGITFMNFWTRKLYIGGFWHNYAHWHKKELTINYSVTLSILMQPLICIAVMYSFISVEYSDYKFKAFSFLLAFKKQFLTKLIWVWQNELDVFHGKVNSDFLWFYFCVCSGSTCWFGDAAETGQREPTGAAVQTTLCLAVVSIP